MANLEPMRVPEGLGEEEAFEFAQQYKARMKGNMIFVGELLKSKMISHRILLECIDRLLQKRLECIEISNGEDQGVPHMEALCAFLHTVGPFFENPKVLTGTWGSVCYMLSNRGEDIECLASWGSPSAAE